ncbi:MAG: histidine kinase dimerization/phospho-acceptor domain-containing protein, partial [Candidatus Sumerlaeota bacterium]
MKIRERIIIAYGGLLILLLLLAGVSLSLISEFNLSLRQVRHDNTSIAKNHIEIFTGLPKVSSAALFSSEEERQNPSLLEAKISDVGAKVRVLCNSLHIPQATPRINDLKKSWNDYAELIRAGYLMPPGKEKSQFWETYLQPAGAKTRDALGDVASLNLDFNDREIGSLQNKLEHAQIVLLSITLLGVLLCIGFLRALGRLFVKPTHDLVQAIEEYNDVPAEKTISSRVRPDEIGAVAGALDRMLDRVRESRKGDARLMKRIERRSEIAMDCLPDAIFLLDREGKISYLNDIARKMIDSAPPDAPAGIPWPLVRRMVERSVESKQPEVRRELDKSLQIFIEGDEKFYLPGVFPIVNEQTDITDEVVLLLNDVSYLRQIDEMKTDLVATVSHQLKTPLTSVRMSLHMIKGSASSIMTPVDKELLTTAIDESERLHETIQSLLDMARIQAGAIEMHLDTVETSTWLEETLKSFRHLLSDKNISLTMDIVADLPPIQIDAPRMSAVLENLMTNCAKYCRSGDSVHIRAKRDRSDPF